MPHTGDRAMLKLENLRFRRRQEKLYVGFVPTSDETARRLCRELLDAFEEAVACRWTRGELEEWCATLTRREKDVKLASGLAKILFDRAQFEESDDTLPELRREVLSRAAAALKNAGGDYRRYRDELRGGRGDFDLYGDLPEFARLEKCREFASPEELIDAYNIALVQGLLLHSEKLTLKFKSPRPENLRPLLRRMRFHRLLATGTKLTPEEMALEIDGPFSILENSRKYALQLAMFFPSVLQMPDWHLFARLKLGDREVVLDLNSDSPLRQPRHRADYMPPEIAAFRAAFKSPEWELLPEAPPLLPDSETPVLPDFSFRHIETGQIAHIELFHRWHKTGLARRIADPEKLKKLHLVIGADRALAAILDADTQAEDAGLLFRFRDFPGVETTLRALKKSGFGEVLS